MSLKELETTVLLTKTYMYDAFLSHNSVDKADVEALAIRLEDEVQVKPFLDKWHLVPGEPWQEELEEALDKSATCVVFLGPSGLGPWQNEELRSSLDDRVRNKAFRVIPVLLPRAEPQKDDTLPRFLRRLTWVDFREGLEDRDAFHRLVAGIKGEQPGRQSSPSIEKSFKWVLVLTGTVGDADKTQVEAIAEHLRKISGDIRLTINKVESGSIKLTIESSEEAFRKIMSLYYQGELEQILGAEVLRIQSFAEDEVTSIFTEEPPAPREGGGSIRLYVGNLSFSTSSDDLEEMFGQFGKVESARIIEDHETGRSRGFAFVEMSSKEEAQEAISSFDGKERDGHELTVNEAKPREARRGNHGGFGEGESD